MPSPLELKTSRFPVDADAAGATVPSEDEAVDEDVSDDDDDDTIADEDVSEEEVSDVFDALWFLGFFKFELAFFEVGLLFVSTVSSRSRLVRFTSFDFSSIPSFFLSVFDDEAMVV